MRCIRKRRVMAATAAAVAVPLALGGFISQTHVQGPTPSPTGTFGPDCANLPKKGEGSIAAVAKERVADAAAAIPQLAQLASALKKAGLGSTLNDADNITLFAPTNHAFNKMSKSQRNALLNDPDQLKKVLTYHVVDEDVTPSELPNGSFETLEGSKLTTSGSGTSFKVNDTANIVCGNITTANATVYLVDAALSPPA